MNEPLSTSNSSEPASQRWPLIITLSAIITSLCVFLWEGYLLKEEPLLSVPDSYELWAKNRAKLASSNQCSMTIVGASRSQMALDLSILEKLGPSRPIQLSIMGSRILPVLENLAMDSNVKGTILVSFEENNFARIDGIGRAEPWTQKYQLEITEAHEDPAYFVIERALKSIIDELFMFRKDGGKPMDLLSQTMLNRYTYMDYERRIFADFNRTNAEDIYQKRIEHYIGQDPKHYHDPRWESDQLPRLNKAIEQLQVNGAKVVLIRFPSTKAIWQGEQIKYPREVYWDRLEATTKAITFHFTESPELMKVSLPDGVHPDFRDAPLISQIISQRVFSKTPLKETIEQCQQN
ncbi:MAG: hypothetical protein MI867_02765 [Pseudomonadales bacterium]|nr:hypothetical protein [Pseudomonadales bacterium]